MIKQWDWKSCFFCRVLLYAPYCRRFVAFFFSHLHLIDDPLGAHVLKSPFSFPRTYAGCSEERLGEKKKTDQSEMIKEQFKAECIDSR